MNTTLGVVFGKMHNLFCEICICSVFWNKCLSLLICKWTLWVSSEKQEEKLARQRRLLKERIFVVICRGTIHKQHFLSAGGMGHPKNENYSFVLPIFLLVFQMVPTRSTYILPKIDIHFKTLSKYLIWIRLEHGTELNIIYIDLQRIPGLNCKKYNNNNNKSAF